MKDNNTYDYLGDNFDLCCEMGFLVTRYELVPSVLFWLTGFMNETGQGRKTCCRTVYGC
jgi:hypothetical protein